MTLTDIELLPVDEHGQLVSNPPPEARAVSVAVEPVVVPPLSPGLLLTRAIVITIATMAASFFIYLLVITPILQAASQRRVFADFRAQLAIGTIPIGPVDVDGDPVPIGAPIAQIAIPAINVDEVVVEGTTSGALMIGPGHRRDTPLPGQAGVSVLLGRRGTFGAPFADLSKLQTGDLIRVNTGQGTFVYNVTGIRYPGDLVPEPPAANISRLTLVTATGTRFLPDGLVRVDASLDGTAVGGASRTMAFTNLPPAERLLADDTTQLWKLALWLFALAGLAIGSVWAWYRHSRAHAWVVFLPPMALVVLVVSAELTRLLPNLL